MISIIDRDFYWLMVIAIVTDLISRYSRGQIMKFITGRNELVDTENEYYI